MSKKHNQIGQQLHQGGITAGQAQAVAKWLADKASSLVREIGPGDAAAENPNWLNQFRPPEAPPLPNPGNVANADGVANNVAGVPGFNNPDRPDPGGDPLPPNFPGIPPQAPGGDQTVIRNNLGYNDTDLRPLFMMLSDLARRVASLEFEVAGLRACCRANANAGGAPNAEQGRKIADLSKRLKAVEKDLSDAQECV